MQFSKTTADMVKPLLHLIKKCGTSSKRTTSQNTSLQKAQTKIYHDIKKGDEFVDTLVNSGCFEPSISSVREVPKTYDSRYFPKTIKDYIHTNGKYQLTYQCDVHGRSVKIMFTLFTEGDVANIKKYNQSARFIYTWLYICGQYSLRKCSKTLNIYLYFTPFTKLLPSSNTVVLGAEHVNTAFTYNCIPHGEIVLYREEEWKKVFIHETFHSFGLDFGDYQYDNIKRQLHSIFPVKSDFEFTETYTETWARIIHSAFVSYFSLEDKKDKDEFLLHMNFSLEVERLFSLQQLIRVLQFMGLKYGDLYKRCDTCQMLRQNMYREDTHVLAYYVLTGILMNDYAGFLSWCTSHNVNMYKFDATPHNMSSFISLIKSYHDCISFKESLACVMKYLRKTKYPIINTMRMTVLELGR
tara:strand:+ start:9252 stop:10484 length:1233 start_codon:yes stop_codon:yes gene_type:complete